MNKFTTQSLSSLCFGGSLASVHFPCPVRPTDPRVHAVPVPAESATELVDPVHQLGPAECPLLLVASCS